MGFLENHFGGWKFHRLLGSSFQAEYSMFFWKTIFLKNNHMGFWNFLFQKEIPIFSEMHFSKNGKSREVLKNYFVFKIMGFIDFLWKTNSLFRSTFGKKNKYIYIYIYIWKYSLSWKHFRNTSNFWKQCLFWKTTWKSFLEVLLDRPLLISNSRDSHH